MFEQGVGLGENRSSFARRTAGGGCPHMGVLGAGVCFQQYADSCALTAYYYRAIVLAQRPVWVITLP
jgi:hypothetical protein